MFYLLVNFNYFILANNSIGARDSTQKENASCNKKEPHENSQSYNLNLKRPLKKDGVEALFASTPLLIKFKL
jgi:hypothetical protein